MYIQGILIQFIMSRDQKWIQPDLPGWCTKLKEASLLSFLICFFPQVVVLIKRWGFNDKITIPLHFPGVRLVVF